MLAVATSEGFTLISQPQLKVPPASLPITQSLPFTRTLCWSQDNLSLFVATNKTINKHDASGAHLNQVFQAESTVTNLIAKDKNGSVLVIAAGPKVLLTSDGRVTNTLETHKTAAVVATALSKDGQLLASASASAVHIHNVSHSNPVHVVLKNLPPGRVTAAVFHPHSRSRLIVGVGNQVVIYDTTRPSGPLKVVPMSGNVVSISCSPFSKTLVAVGGAEGEIGMLDLEKEKPLFKKLAIKTPIRTLSFSAEGASIYVGTENGALLLLDLRNLEKDPNMISVSEVGAVVVGLAVQTKSKSTPPGDTVKPSKASTSTTKPLFPQDTNNPSARRSSPAQPSTRSPSVQKTMTRDPSRRAAKQVLSPESAALRGGAASQRQKENWQSATTLSSPTRSRSISPSKHQPRDTRPGSSSSVQRTRSRAMSAASASTSASSSSQLTNITRHNTSSATASFRVVSESRPPLSLDAISPAETSEQPDTRASPSLPVSEPMTPLPAVKIKASGMKLLGLGTPEIMRWVEPGANKSIERKKVGFVDESDRSDPGEEEQPHTATIDPPSFQNRETHSNELQLSPLRAVSHSPRRSTARGTAQDFIHQIVKDVVMDQNSELKAETMGLHLDLLRMGAKMTEGFSQILEELKALREENRQLREENDHLRRGY